LLAGAKVRVVALLVLLFTVPLSATAVVVFRTPARIILAADERRMTDDGGKALHPSGGDCKIRLSGKWAFVIGGYSGTDKPGGHVDVFATLAKAVEHEATIRGAVTAVGQAFATTLHDALVEAVTTSSLMYAAGTEMIAVLIAGDGAVGFYGVSITSRDPVTLKTGGALCPGDACTNGRLYFAAAADGTSTKLILRTPRPAWLEQADASAARRVIELQMQATPHEVGEPFDVLQIDASGARWVDRDPRSACQP
jgi:hypothetical protein